MTESKNRIEWVDIGKYICIMFVMLSHLESGSEALDKFYNPFFLTVFFFLSGYVYRKPKSFKEHMVKKTKELFVPWLIFSNFNILLSAIITLKGERNIASDFLWNLLQVRGHDDGVWFVAALFVAFIPFYFFIKWKKPGQVCAVSVILSLVSVIYTHIFPTDILPWGGSALPWHLEYIFQAMLWMILGYFFRIYGEAIFDKKITWLWRAIIWGAYVIVICIPNSIGGVDFSIPFSYVRSILGILAVIYLSKSIKSNRYIRFVGANTLTFFALHGKIYAVIQMLLAKFAGSLYSACLNNALTSSVLAIVITLVLSVILIIPAMIINRWFPWVLGRKKIKKQLTNE